eukprot:Clim_evm116s128 gene=Clim_evmTU116s128
MTPPATGTATAPAAMEVDRPPTELERAEEARKAGNVKEAEKILKSIIARQVGDGEMQALREKEQAMYLLSESYSHQKKVNELLKLVKETRPLLQQLSKARAAKLVRAQVDFFLDMNADTSKAIDMVEECIEWAKTEKRTYLRQALDCRLIALMFKAERLQDALKHSTELMKEIKKLDDKGLLVEVQLLESKIYHRLGNIPKARAALTTARTAGNAIYCPPRLQASLDIHSGILHAEERDFKTSFSYFYEAFEGYDSVDDPAAIQALKYMLLCKVMLNIPEDVAGVMQGKLALKYQGDDIDAMKAIAKAQTDRSLDEFRIVVEQTYPQQIQGDDIVKNHLNSLYDTMQEQNLQRIIEPFVRVEISHIAELIDLEQKMIEAKLSQMILDKKLNGILDQGAGCLIIYDETETDKTYEASLKTVAEMGRVVDSLYRKAHKLS